MIFFLIVTLWKNKTCNIEGDYSPYSCPSTSKMISIIKSLHSYAIFFIECDCSVMYYKQMKHKNNIIPLIFTFRPLLQYGVKMESGCCTCPAGSHVDHEFIALQFGIRLVIMRTSHVTRPQMRRHAREISQGFLSITVIVISMISSTMQQHIDNNTDLYSCFLCTTPRSPQWCTPL